MPNIIRVLLDFSNGHCFIPKPSLNGSLDVFANNIAIVRVGDNYGQRHKCPVTGQEHDMNTAIIGSPNVFVNGKPIHRRFDLISCGDTAGNGSLDVFANENA